MLDKKVFAKETEEKLLDYVFKLYESDTKIAKKSIQKFLDKKRAEYALERLNAMGHHCTLEVINELRTEFDLELSYARDIVVQAGQIHLNEILEHQL